MLICTITGLVIAVTGVLNEGLTGSALALAAFGSTWNVLPYIVVVGLILFAFTTVLAWEYYGEKCVEFLIGTKGIIGYRCVYIAMLVLGAIADLDLIWAIADIANAFMAIPNLIAIIGLSSVVKIEAEGYFAKIKLQKIYQ